MSEIVTRATIAADHNDVLQFVRTYYYPEESLTIGVEPKEQDADDEAFTMSNLENGFSVLCEEVGANGQRELLGVLMAGPKTRGEDVHMLEEAERLKGTKWSTILKILARVEARADVFNRYDVNEAVHGHSLSVSHNARGKGVGMKMIQKSMQLAKQRGVPVWVCDCTSVFSARICEKLGMEHISTMFYSEHCDESGRQIFNPPAIHDRVRTFAKLL